MRSSQFLTFHFFAFLFLFFIVQGLGKTVQAVALIVATLTDLKNQKALYDDYDDDDDNERYHPATLVIVPSA